VFLDGALRGGTIAGNLMLAQPEAMEPRNLLRLANGQPHPWRLGFFTCRRSPAATNALCHSSNPMPIRIPDYGLKTDRLQSGKPMGITSES
jgi:hypothetical protein